MSIPPSLPEGPGLIVPLPDHAIADRPIADRLRVALIGYGLAGRVFHAPLLAADPHFDLALIVTADPTRAADALTDHPTARVVSLVDDVWAMADELDVVVVASANVAHVPQALQALACGLHVVVDKPVAGSAAEAQILAEAARAAQRELHVFQNRRWDSDYLTLRALAPQLGSLQRLESRFERWRPDLRGVWRESPDLAQAGGQLLDLGAHLVDQALHLLGPAVDVSARVRHLRDPASADDDAVITIGHASGALSLLFASAVTAVPGPRFRLLGSQGGVLIEHADTQEDALRLGRHPDDPDWGVESAQHCARVVARDGVGTVVPVARGAWPEFYRRVAASIREGAPAPVPIDEVIAAMRVLDAAKASHGELIRLSQS